jgi:hypothetical protein
MLDNDRAVTTRHFNASFCSLSVFESFVSFLSFIYASSLFFPFSSLVCFHKLFISILFFSFLSLPCLRSCFSMIFNFVFCMIYFLFDL